MSTRKISQIGEVVTKILEPLSKRYQEVLTERYGLGDGTQLSLEKIGKKRGITRERVRQIVNLAFQKIQFPPEGKVYVDWALNQLSLWYGVEPEEILFREAKTHFSIYFPELEDLFEQKLRFLLIASKQIYYSPASASLYPLFYLKENSFEKVKKILDDFNSKLSKKGLLNLGEFVQLIENLSNKYKIPSSVLCTYLRLLKVVDTNILGEVGFRNISRIKPKNIRDQIHLVFQHVNKPLHFSEVVRIIEANNYWPKPLNIHTVHNELIRDQRFVLVGRGIYALKEWGFTGGTTKEVIKRILEKAKRPLSLEEIIKKVKKELQVKEETIKLVLKKEPIFQEVGKNRFFLKKKLKVLRA